MPIPTPTPSEKMEGKKGKNAFISRCVSNESMVKDYPDQKQRLGICFTAYRNSKKKSTGKFDHLENDKIEILDI